MNVHNLKRNNPKYCGIDQEIQVNIDNLNMKMQPVSINELLKFLQNSKPNKSFNLMEKEEFIDSLLSDSLISEGAVS